MCMMAMALPDIDGSQNGLKSGSEGLSRSPVVSHDCTLRFWKLLFAAVERELGMH